MFVSRLKTACRAQLAPATCKPALIGRPLEGAGQRARTTRRARCKCVPIVRVCACACVCERVHLGTWRWFARKQPQQRREGARALEILVKPGGYLHTKARAHMPKWLPVDSHLSFIRWPNDINLKIIFSPTCLTYYLSLELFCLIINNCPFYVDLSLSLIKHAIRALKYVNN